MAVLIANRVRAIVASRDAVRTIAVITAGPGMGGAEDGRDEGNEAVQREKPNQKRDNLHSQRQPCRMLFGIA
jgi:hypothetical protein